MGSLSIWHWIVVIAVILLLFGRGKISELMGDVAQGIKAFKKGMSDDETAKTDTPVDPKIITDDASPPIRSSSTPRPSASSKPDRGASSASALEFRGRRPLGWRPLEFERQCSISAGASLSSSRLSR